MIFKGTGTALVTPFRDGAVDYDSYERLLEKDTTFGGMKPRRTFVGPRYNAGVSDHLPIVVYLYF